MLVLSRAGYYKLRFRVSPRLVSLFNRKEINKSLETKVYAIAKAKADIIRHKYEEILKVSKKLKQEELEELVSIYITETLDQDLEVRASTGQGTVITTVDESNPYTATPALASAYMSDLLKSDYQEDLSNSNYKLIESTVDELLQANSITIEKGSTSYNKLSYYMMLAQIQILEEASSRGHGHIPKQPQEISSKLFGSASTPAKRGSGKKAKAQEKALMTVADALAKYLTYYTQEAKSKGTQELQINEVTTFLNEVFINIIGKNENVAELTIEDIIDYKELLSQFPSRARNPYNKMSTQEIVSCIFDGKIEEGILLIGKSTLNKYLGYSKAFFEYCNKTSIINNNPMALIATSRGGANALDERLPLELEEINHLLELTKDKPVYNNMVKVFYTSGMRLSELYKCKVHEVERTLVYDLTDKSIELKNKSSYRLVPVHPSIDIELLSDIPSRPTFSRYINTLIRENISEDNRKVLYSLRHSFATVMKNNRVEPTVISELMGHSHQTMTLSRYASKYDVSILKEAIETISL